MASKVTKEDIGKLPLHDFHDCKRKEKKRKKKRKENDKQFLNCPVFHSLPRPFQLKSPHVSLSMQLRSWQSLKPKEWTVKTHHERSFDFFILPPSSFKRESPYKWIPWTSFESDTCQNGAVWKRIAHWSNPKKFGSEITVRDIMWNFPKQLRRGMMMKVFTVERRTWLAFEKLQVIESTIILLFPGGLDF